MCGGVYWLLNFLIMHETTLKAVINWFVYVKVK